MQWLMRVKVCLADLLVCMRPGRSEEKHRGAHIPGEIIKVTSKGGLLELYRRAALAWRHQDWKGRVWRAQDKTMQRTSFKQTHLLASVG